MRLIAKALLAATAVAGFSGAALAADLYVPPAAAPAAPVAAPTSWDGPYIGANIGYGWGSADSTSAHQYNDPTNTITTDDSLSMSGFMVGGQIGYNFHLSDNIVGGIEGSLDWTNQTGTTDSNSNYPGITHTINWDGMIVAKLGVDVGGNILPYIDAGLAFANSTRDSSGCTNCFYVDSSHKSDNVTQAGWTVGVGVEAMLADNLSGFVSYNYADYGSADFN